MQLCPAKEAISELNNSRGAKHQVLPGSAEGDCIYGAGEASLSAYRVLGSNGPQSTTLEATTNGSGTIVLEEAISKWSVRRLELARALIDPGVDVARLFAREPGRQLSAVAAEVSAGLSCSRDLILRYPTIANLLLDAESSFMALVASRARAKKIDSIVLPDIDYKLDAIEPGATAEQQIKYLRECINFANFALARAEVYAAEDLIQFPAKCAVLPQHNLQAPVGEYPIRRTPTMDEFKASYAAIVEAERTIYDYSRHYESICCAVLRAYSCIAQALATAALAQYG